MSNEPTPLVIVEGFLGSPGAICWGAFKKYLDDGRTNRRVLFAKVGPVSSLHDRACELYYALKGGTVDYGHEHSEKNGHARYGRRIEQGLYPQWSPTMPLHFLGHSMGGPTVTKLQHLLLKGHFGSENSPGMILSLTSVSSPFRGTQLVYVLGERTDAAPLVRPLSVGSLLAKWVHIVSYLSPLLPAFMDLRAEARCLSFRDISLHNLFDHLWKSDWAEGRDATPFDVTFAAADEREGNREGEPWHETFYYSYVASTDPPIQDVQSIYQRLSSPISSLVSYPFNWTSNLIETFEPSIVQPLPSFLQETSQKSKFHSSDIEEEEAEKGFHFHDINSHHASHFTLNDGVVPLFSQFHPFSCGQTSCKHLIGTQICDSSQLDLRPGVWYVSQVDAANHVSLVPFWVGTQRQRDFWTHVGNRLNMVDGLRSTFSCK